jgi:predicted nucleic acid-binding protein
MPIACVDSNIWLYALLTPAEGENSKNRTARQLISTLDTPVITPQIINEVCFNLLRKQKWPEEDIQSLIRSLHVQCRLFIPGEEWPVLASSLRFNMRLSFWDSLIVSSALSAGCGILYSEDMQHGQVLDGITITNPFIE